MLNSLSSRVFIKNAFICTINSKCSYFVPSVPQWNEVNKEKLPLKRILSSEDVDYLESVSLVQYKNTALEKARLEQIIQFADVLQLVNTDDIEPMTYVCHNEPLYLRKDVVTDPGCAKDILKNAKIVTEDYFVAPPGNVSFAESERKKYAQ